MELPAPRSHYIKKYADEFEGPFGGVWKLQQIETWKQFPGYITKVAQSWQCHQVRSQGGPRLGDWWVHEWSADIPGYDLLYIRWSRDTGDVEELWYSGEHQAEGQPLGPEPCGDRA